MQLSRFNTFVSEVGRDISINELANRIDVFRFFSGRWFDTAGDVIIDVTLVESLGLCRESSEPVARSKSLDVFFCVPRLDAVVRATFFLSPKKPTRSKFSTHLERCLKHSEDAFDASHDALTGLLNKVEFEEEVRRLVASGPSSSEAIGEVASNVASIPTTALITFDIDHFKQLNDTHGHLYGDYVLRCFARRIDTASNNAMPGCEVRIGRTGGEEFSIALRGTFSDEEVRVFALDLLRAISQTPLPSDDEWQELAAEAEAASVRLPHVADRGVTISIGTASALATLGAPAEVKAVSARLIGQADTAMYRAKAGGRNTIRHFGEVLSRHGRIIQHHEDSDVVVIDIGSQVNVAVGQEFLVYHPDFSGDVEFVFSDGRTRKRLGKYPRYSSGRLVVFNVQQEISFCKVLERSPAGRLQEGSHLEAVPVGAISHLIAADPHLATLGAPDIARPEQLVERAKAIAGKDGRWPTACVVTVDSVDDVTRDRGTAFVNQALARLYTAMRSSFSSAATIGQLQPAEVAVVSEEPSTEIARERLTSAIQRAEEACHGLVFFIAGIFSGPPVGDDVEAQRMREIDRSRALDCARYASSRAGRGTEKVTQFSTFVASHVLNSHRRSQAVGGAEADYAAFTEMGLRSPHLENQFGLCLFERTAPDLEAVVAAFRRAIERDSTIQIFHANLAIAEFARGNHTVALEEFMLGGAEDPEGGLGEVYRAPFASAMCWANLANPGLVSNDRILRALGTAREVPRARRSWLTDRGEIEAILGRLATPVD